MTIIKNYETISLKYKIAHSEAAMYYSLWSIRMNITNIILVSATGVANNITATLNVDSKPLSVCYSIVLYLSVLLNTIQRFLKYEELSEKHKTFSIRYNHLYNLCLVSTESQLTDIIQEYEDIYKNAPDIPEKIKLKEDSDIENTPEIIDIATSHQLNRLIIQSYKG
jgi:hypothetical protein